MFDETVTILENKKINAEYFKLVFSSARLSRNVKPGQFLNLQIEDDTDPFLRRPFSYYRVNAKKIEILYEVLGRGTKILSRKRKGDDLKILGPLGRCFTQNIKGKQRVLIGGGVGVPPLIYLAEKVGAEKKKSIFFIGCRSRNQVMPKRELTKIKGQIFYSTEDGSYGKQGLVTVLLRELLEKEEPKKLFIQTCGPNAMMKAVMHIAMEYGADGEASIDERMACGVGTCLGCVVETEDGFKTSCVEGPVFSFKGLKHFD